MPTLTAEQVAQINYQAGFRGNDLVIATAIAKRESGYNPTAHRTDTNPKRVTSGDRGLFQINYVNDQNLINAGIIRSANDLFNPIINAKAAFYLYQRSNSTFAPWSMGPGGWTAGGSPTYGTDTTAARNAVSSAATKGLFGTDFKFDDSWWQNVGTTGTGSASGAESAGGLDVLNKVAGAFLDPLNIIPGNPVNTIGEAIKLGAQLVMKLLDLQTWVRLLQIVGGGVLVVLGLYVMVGPELQKAVAPMAMDAAKLAAV